MNHPFFSYEEARKTDIIRYLEKLGYFPQKIRNDDYWYLSPLREESKASFKVNRKLNSWYDFGLGRGGNVIDFGMLYHKCSYKELLEKLPGNFLFHPQTQTFQQHPTRTQNHPDALEPKIKVIAARPLIHPALCSYLRERKIPFQIASQHCQEVHCERNGKSFFAIGFKNNSDGFELRNLYFKGSSSPKDITLIEASKTKEITVFEGFFNCLSFLAINKNIEQPLTNLPDRQTGFLVLNSLSFFEKSRELMEEHKKINLYLDRDNAGFSHTQNALKWDLKYVDKSDLYKNHKDLNDFLIRQNQEQKQVLKIRRHI